MRPNKDETAFCDRVRIENQLSIVTAWHFLLSNIQVCHSNTKMNRLQKLIYLYLFTDCFMQISLQSSEQIIDHKALHWALYHVWFQDKSELYHMNNETVPLQIWASNFACTPLVTSAL